MKPGRIDLTGKGFYPGIVEDYLLQKPGLSPFYRYSPALPEFKKVIDDFSKSDFNRPLLEKVISGQYERCGLHFTAGILTEKNTFTVCTGHQLCIFTGPLYFIYKIFSTINLAEELKKNYPQYNFVPLFWMASEDHDFEEISRIHLFGKTLEWKNKQGGAAGKFSTKGIEELLHQLKTISDSPFSQELIGIFSNAYLHNDNLADATRILLHSLFGNYGLYIIDADDERLKELFLPVFEDDLFGQTAYNILSKTIAELKKEAYHPQVNPREINLFLLSPGERKRIEKQDVLADQGKWKNILKKDYKNLSPNVALRPLFQQKILPNIAYTGGPAELAYWLEYKKLFDHYKINFPVLLLRNSVFWIDKKSSALMEKYEISESELFDNTAFLINKFINKNAGGKINFSSEKEHLLKFFYALSQKTKKEDTGLAVSVEAESHRLVNFLDQLEKKMLRIEKHKNESAVNQIVKLKEKLFPENKMQERYQSFIPLYFEYGKEFFEMLKDALKPFDKKVVLFRESPA